LEDAVNNQTQPLEEQFRSQLVSIVQDCQNRIFSDYRSKRANTEGKPTPGTTGIDACVTPPSEGCSEGILDAKSEQKDVVSSACRPPTPQNTLEMLPDLSNIQASDMPPSAPVELSFSDSAYSSTCLSSSQADMTPSKVQGSSVTKPSDGQYSHLPIEDYGSSGFVQHDFCLDAFDITADLNNNLFDDWWANSNTEG
jgi:hypothetical protein